MKDSHDKSAKASIGNKNRTTLNLSVSIEDKRILKMYAAEQDVTVASVIHECITEYLLKKERMKE